MAYPAAVQVSVVIPCYNSLRYLPETLASVLDQDLPPELEGAYEVVLVDDGGSDDLAGWVERLGDERVRVVRQDNAGVAAARNTGIRSAKGAFVAFCDSDDLWEPTTVAELWRAFGDDPRVGLTYGGYDVIDEEGRPTGRASICDWQGEVWERLITGNRISASVVMLRREVFDDVGYFAENRHRFPVDVEDWELWLRVAARWRVGVAPRVLMHVRRHGENATLDIESLEAAYANLLEVAFADVSPERRALRPVCAANIEVRIASMWLNDRRDARTALEHLRRARREWVGVRRDPEYWKLVGSAAALRLTGPRGFEALRHSSRSARRALRRLDDRRWQRT